jgi:hypothetical protein
MKGFPSRRVPTPRISGASSPCRLRAAGPLIAVRATHRQFFSAPGQGANGR